MLRNTDARVTNTTVSDNDGYGVVVWNADVQTFAGNTVTGNGFPTTAIPTSEDGVLVHANGDLDMGAPLARNVVSGNSARQLNVLNGGFLFVGRHLTTSDPSENSILAENGGSVLIRNNSGGNKVYAQDTWWGDAGGPPSGSFSGNSLIIPSHHLTSPPPPPCGPFGCNRQEEGPIWSQAARTSDVGYGREIDLEALHAELLAFRDSLAQTPDAPEAPEWVRTLYYLQRSDYDDALGEYAATMALLTGLRENLDEANVSTGLQHTGEAALGAEVAEALLREEYDAAEGLLASYVDATVEEGLVSLMLSAVATHEQAERYDAALALLAQATALVPEHAAELALIAALIEEQMVEQTAGRGAGEHAMGEAAEPLPTAASRAGDATLPAEYALHAAYPNPTARSATVPFDLPEASEVRVVVYDLLGREVALLAEGLHEAGRHEAEFDASRLASGVYVARAEIVPTGEAVQAFTQKLTLLK